MYAKRLKEKKKSLEEKRRGRDFASLKKNRTGLTGSTEAKRKKRKGEEEVSLRSKKMSHRANSVNRGLREKRKKEMKRFSLRSKRSSHRANRVNRC